MSQSCTMVSKTTLPLLQRAQVCKPLYPLRLTYWGEVWRGWWRFPPVILFPPKQWLLTLILQGEEELPFWEQGWGQMVPLASSKKILTQSKRTEWVLNVDMGAGDKARRKGRGELRCNLSPLPPQPTHQVQPTFPLIWRLHLLCSCSWRNYSCLWNSMARSHGILSHLCYFVWTYMCLFLFILLDFKFSEGRMYVWTILFVILTHPPPD